MTKRVWVFRHAESLSNAGGKTLDPQGIPLTENGRRQARDLAWSLKEAPQRLITSPFRRAIETGQPIDARYPAALNEIWPIQEFTYLEPASCVGTNWADRKPRIDAFWAKLDPELVDGPGAESFSQLLARARGFLEDLSELTTDLTIIISHGQFMQAARLMAQRPEENQITAMSLFIDRQLRRPPSRRPRGPRASETNGGMRRVQRWA